MRISLIVLLGVVSSGAAAQPAVPPLSAEQAVQTAVQNNPHVVSALQAVLAARYGVRAARSLVNPTFFVAPALGNNNGTTEELLFSQPLELNGTRAAREGIANAQLRGVQANSLLEVRELIASTKRAYYELARAREQQALALSLLAASEEFDRLTRRQIELGSRPGIEGTQTALEVERARQQAALAEGRVIAAEAALNALMGRKSEEPISPLRPLEAAFSNPLPETKPLSPTPAHPEIARAEAARDVYRQEARLERAEGLPDIAPQFRVQRFGSADYGFSVAVTIPLFDWGGRRARLRQAETSQKAQEAQIAAARLQIQQDIAQAEARQKAAERVVQSYREKILEQAKRLLEASRKGFQTGAPGTTLLTVLDAQRTYRAVQTDYLDALAALALAQVERERAAGVLPHALLKSLTELETVSTRKERKKP